MANLAPPETSDSLAVAYRRIEQHDSVGNLVGELLRQRRRIVLRVDGSSSSELVKISVLQCACSTANIMHGWYREQAQSNP